MSDLLLYLIKANVALALFCLGYYILLRKLTFYNINRYYLIFALAFSALYPLIPFDDWLASRQEMPTHLLLSLSDWQHLQLPQEADTASSSFSVIYWISIGLFGLLFLIKLMGIGRIHFRSVPAQWDRFSYRKINKIISPFSFWTNIYFNPLLHTENEYEKIFSHEQVHVRQLHSMDVLVAEVALIFFWYNPFCWLIRKAIQENIEFITDQRVLFQGIDKKSYQYSLVKISTSTYPSYLGSHFNFKNLKKRIVMMNKKQSSKIQLGKYAFIIPAVVLASLILGVSKEYVKAEGSSNSAQDTPRANDPLHVVDGTFLSEGDPIKLKSTEIESIEVITDAAAHNIYGTKAQNGVINVTTKKGSAQTVNPSALQDTLKSNKPLYIVDGKKQSSIEEINTETIKSIDVIKGDGATSRYGEEGKYGVLLVTTKDASQDPVVQEVSRPDNKISVKISTDSLQLTANLENYKEDKEPVVIGIKNNKVTSMGGVDENVLIFIDGKRISSGSLDQIDPNNIQSISVFKGENAIKRYGEAGRDGVIDIISKVKN
jgi:TonB-dependent SusC/RagA subfamily outer membrane receptor